jgi:hypothetical protein
MSSLGHSSNGPFFVRLIERIHLQDEDIFFKNAIIQII